MKRIALLAIALAACDNAGADRTSGISATGIVYGSVFFDANGSRTADADDPPFAGARIRILGPVSGDTVVRITTDAGGRFRVAAVPVGTYRMVIDPTSGGDSAVVVLGGGGLVSVSPADSVAFLGALGFPLRTIADVRATGPGAAPIFVVAIALNARTTFADTTVHLVDATGAIRATRVRPSAVPVSAGDSVRVRARIGVRLGQIVLDDVSIFVVTPTFIPPAPVLTTAQAATAAGASQDAQLVRLTDAAITDTSTVAGNLTMTIDDGSGPVRVVLDRTADVGFRSPFPVGEYQAPNRFDVTGVLVPTGLGTWVVKPRSPLDLLRR